MNSKPLPRTELNLDNAQALGGELVPTIDALASRVGTESLIRNDADLQQAVIDRQDIADAIARVVEYFQVPKKMAWDLHHTLCQREKKILQPLQALDALRRQAMSDYKVAVDREREQRERAAADQRRRDDEARAADEAARLEQQGEPELAAAVLAEAIAAPAPVVALPDVTKNVAGLKFRRAWHWRITGGPSDVALTPPAVLARALSLVPREFLKLDESKISRYVANMKTSARIPGIDVFYTDDPVR